MIVTQSKLRRERYTLYFYFTADLLPLETIADHSVEVEVWSGEDPTPEALLFLAGGHSGQVVWQQVQLGVPGVIYLIKCTGVTDTGKILERQTKLAILPSPDIIPDLYATWYTTKIYPIEHQAFYKFPNQDVVDGRLRYQPFPLDSLQVPVISILSAELYGSVKSFSTREEYKFHSFSASGTLEVKLISIDVGRDEFQFGLGVMSGDLDKVVIEYTHPPEEYKFHTLSNITGTLT